MGWSHGGYSRSSLARGSTTPSEAGAAIYDLRPYEDPNTRRPRGPRARAVRRPGGDREMSTKKQLRRARRQRQEVTKKANPATLFMLGVAAALLVLGTLAFFFGGGGPPGPGSVWSAEHGHWH